MTDKDHWIDDVQDGDDGSSGRNGHWVIDKKIPLALIFTLVIFLGTQTGAFVWWMAATSQRVDQLEKVTQTLVTASAPVALLSSKVEALDAVTKKTSDAVEAQGKSLVQVGVTLGFVQDTAARIERSITERFSAVSVQPIAPVQVRVQPRQQAVPQISSSIPMPPRPATQ